MKKAILIIVSHLLLVFAQAFAQIPELTHSSVIPPSPVASELTKYITYPVDLCNGLVKTNIPLYEIVDGDIRIPITLNYHASGLKPNMRSSHWPVTVGACPQDRRCHGQSMVLRTRKTMCLI